FRSGVWIMTRGQQSALIIDHNRATLEGPAAAYTYAAGAARGLTSLESERMGLLANPSSRPREELRLEDWIASNLDIDVETLPRPRNVWNQIVAGLPGLKGTQARAGAKQRSGFETPNEGWPRFDVAYKRGITVVRLRDKALLKESMIQELA